MPRLHHALDVLNLEPGLLLEGRDVHETAFLKQVARWSKDYLTKPHPDLGRPGAVCPWVEKSIQRRLFHLTLIPDAHQRVAEVERTFGALREHFQRLDPVAFNEGQYKAIVMIFTGLPADSEAGFIAELHERLKPTFVEQGLMLGEFFSTSVKTGLRNPTWHPLRSSPPLLVIRHMVRPDIAFLSDRKHFVQAYLRRFPQEGCTELRNFIERAKARLTPESVAMLQETLREFQEAQVASTGTGR